MFVRASKIPSEKTWKGSEIKRTFGRLLINPWALAILAAFSTSSWETFDIPIVIFSLMVPVNKTGSCWTTPRLDRSQLISRSSMWKPSTRIWRCKLKNEQLISNTIIYLTDWSEVTWLSNWFNSLFQHYYREAFKKQKKNE